MNVYAERFSSVVRFAILSVLPPLRSRALTNHFFICFSISNKEVVVNAGMLRMASSKEMLVCM